MSGTMISMFLAEQFLAEHCSFYHWLIRLECLNYGFDLMISIMLFNIAP